MNKATVIDLDSLVEEETLTKEKVKSLDKKALFESALALKEGLGTVAKEGLTVVGIVAAAAAPSVGVIVGFIGFAGHRIMSKFNPRGTHPDLYKEIDSLKERLENLEK